MLKMTIKDILKQPVFAGIAIVSGFIIGLLYYFLTLSSAIAHFDVDISIMPVYIAASIMLTLIVAVLGGMTTLIGSGTNLLVSGALEELGEKPFSFFQFVVPGVVMASVGLAFILIVVPRLLKDRASFSQNYMEADGKHFLA